MRFPPARRPWFRSLGWLACATIAAERIGAACLVPDIYPRLAALVLLPLILRAAGLFFFIGGGGAFDLLHP